MTCEYVYRKGEGAKDFVSLVYYFLFLGILGVGVGWKSGSWFLINNYKMTEREVSDR